jgi:hypothetical protein
MNLRSLFIITGAAVLSGCATITPPPATVEGIPLRVSAAHGITIKQAEFKQVNGRLVLSGWAMKTQRWTSTHGVHIDVRFHGPNGESLALHTADVSFRPARHSNPPAAFSTAIEEWPAGSAAVICEPHIGMH